MMIRAYLDNNATTRLDPEALAAMMPYLTNLYVNPSSAAGELFGTAQPLTEAKRCLARLLGAPELADNLVLTSGASESNSWAVHAATAGRGRGHIVATAIEHPSLMAAFESCRDAGWDVEFASPDEHGCVAPEAVTALLRPETALVSVMLANNETGVIQPVADIGHLVRDLSPSALFHVDVTQAVGRISISLNEDLIAADLVSLSGHKFHGPNGVGALFAADGVRLPPLIYGSQESGRRGGTPDAAAAAGLATAAKLALERLPEMAHVATLRDNFEHALIDCLPELRILGRMAHRLPNTSAFVIPGMNAQHAVEALAHQGVVVAAGSACTSGSPAPSHVMLAMGLSYEEAKSTLRVSLSRETTADEIALAIDCLSTLVRSAL
ncbi:cysteine desulfurase family protein [Telmatospirillum siberiense]|uniref:Cysteine desulfurase n=1 Tax=Telmatospirillum siberiense TaxID=382514 RepID=A0A2N3PR73_9PROT|nr:cysteine desulfurase family protein [Telmatospirillum siberiense]PKU22910.1 cysteine desulfurase NifS [Telmatospirillum siberiense]